MLHAEHFQQHSAHFPLFGLGSEAPLLRTVRKQESPHSIPSNVQLNVFEELPVAYEPSTWWLDGHKPDHPHFDNAEKIQFLTRTIKTPLLTCILDGFRLLLDRAGRQDLLPTLDEHDVLWRASVSMHKYGVVYLGARSECRHEFLPALESRPAAFAAVDAFVRADSNHVRAINYGVHRFVTSAVTVDHPGRLVPPNAIASTDLFRVAVRPQDFEGASAERLDVASPLWDLHDFAHHTTASLAPALFASKYFSELVRLPPKYTALIRSPGMSTAAPKPKCSDGVVFSELLTGLFTAEAEKGEHTYASLTATLAEQVAEYLQGRRALRHLSTGAWLRMSEPIAAARLAVLAQNKAYELTASEMEQRVMTRGGGAGDTRDELDGLSAADRIRFLATCRRWMYFEVRNTVKHRAHKMAYRIVAERMLAEKAGEDDEDTRLLRLTIDALDYKGWENDEVPNLWQVVMEQA